jgi:hypothetical protein
MIYFFLAIFMVVVFNYWRTLMVSVQELKDGIGELAAIAQIVDQKMDAVLLLIQTLKAGVPLSQAEIDNLATTVASVKSSLTETSTKEDTATS